MKRSFSLALTLFSLASSSCSDSPKKPGTGDECGAGSENSSCESSDNSSGDSTADGSEVKAGTDGGSTRGGSAGRDSGTARDGGAARDTGAARDGAVAGGPSDGGSSSSGSPSSSDASQSTGGGGPVVSDGGPTAVGGLDPIIPEINGDCPTIKAGTSTVNIMGLSATVIAGEQKQGTGSLLVYYYGTGKLGDVSFLPGAIKTDIMSQGGIVFALNNAKNTGGDCSGTGTFGIDDFKVVDQFVACAVKNYGINAKRIYATGCSAGGLAAGCMGIMRSNYIAGTAPNSGGITIGYGKLQDPQRVPNVITMNGGGADNVIVNFGETSEGYDNYILKYGGFAVNCIHSSGHCGAPASVYQSAWQFLKDHPFGTKPSPYANGLPSGFDPVCKIFTMTDRAPIGGY